MIFPEIDPNAFSIFGFSIKWYGLAYAAGLFFGLWNSKRVINKIPGNSTSEDIDKLLIWSALGIVIGGRLGYGLFYNIDYYLENPLKIITDIRKGGMSFHGGLIGIVLATWIYSKKNNLNFLQITDSIACSASIGIFFGRISNFINSELWGKVTNSSFGVIFPNGGILPRHPSQLYEAFFEGLVLLFLINWIAYKKLFKKAGALSGTFLFFYGLFRIFCENFREADLHIGYTFQFISQGMILSTPMIFIGLILILKYK